MERHNRRLWVLKMFTLDHTYEELISIEPVGRAVGNFFPSCWMQRIPSVHNRDAMRSIAETVQLESGRAFPAEAFVESANLLMEAYEKQRFCFVPLWKKQPEGWIPDADLNREESVYLLTGNPKVDNYAFAQTSGEGSVPPYESGAVPVEKRKKALMRPAVIICPGGGYHMLSTYFEGIQLAQRLERDGGYKAFILNYRMLPNLYPLPQIDLAMAVMYVRLHGAEYGIDPERVIVLGSSAGGHLCASEAFLYDSLKTQVLSFLTEKRRVRYQKISARPDGVGLLYPVISFLSEYHEGSYLNLTGGREELRDKLSVELHIGKDYPPTYAFANEDDGCVPASNTVRLDKALEKAGVPHLCQIFPSGDHGIGLGYEFSCRKWSENMLAFFENKPSFL